MEHYDDPLAIQSAINPSITGPSASINSNNGGWAGVTIIFHGQIWSPLPFKIIPDFISFSGATTRLSKCQQLLSGIEAALTQENLTLLEPTLPYIQATLENAQRSIESSLSQAPRVKEGDSDTQFKPSFTVAPGQTHDKQLQFYRTTQKCGRKRQDTLK